MDEHFLITNDVGAFVEMPLWTPAEYTGIEQVNICKALAAGLHFRTLHETIQDTLTWRQTCDEAPLKAGLSPERESDLLAAWHERN